MTLQDESGQVNFGISEFEEKLIDEFSFEKRKKLVLCKADVSKSVDRIDFNAWDKFCWQSKKSSKLLVC
jgi:hypothetical protein